MQKHAATRRRENGDKVEALLAHNCEFELGRGQVPPEGSPREASAPPVTASLRAIVRVQGPHPMTDAEKPDNECQ